jgi:CheY-like chemotaxis protein
MLDAIPAPEARLRVLVAEDDPVSRLLVQRAVERLGHSCAVAADGTEAWSAYRALGPDVVITDWAMPGLDGGRLAALIRASGAPTYTYIVVLSGVADEAAAREVMLAGADDLLLKPLDPAQLERKLIAAARVTALHRRLPAAPEVDAATGLPTIAQLDADLPAWRRARGSLPGFLALVELDPAAEAELTAAAEVLAAQRGDAPVYLLGEGRLGLLLDEATNAAAGRELERLRDAVARVHPPGGTLRVGLGALEDPARPLAEVLAEARAALAESVERDDRLRVMVADDDPIARLLLTALLEREPTVEFAGAAEDADGAIELARSARPDVVLVDYEMPGGGARAADRIRTEHRATRVVALSAHDGPEAMMAMGHAGSVGYVVKGAPDEEIVRAIHSAARW